MVTYPEIITTPDTPTVRFHQPRDQVNLYAELPRIVGIQGWSCGTYFNVQFLNHEKTRLLACARFVVTEEDESVQTSNANPYQPMTKTVFTRKAEQVDDWWTPPREPGEAVAVAPEGIVPGKRRGRPPKQAVA